MCLAIPMKVVKVEDEIGIVEYKGIQKKINLSLVHPIDIGDYVLVHTGFAIQKIDEEEFYKTMEILEEESKIKEELFPEELDLDSKTSKFIKFNNNNEV